MLYVSHWGYNSEKDTCDLCSYKSVQSKKSVPKTFWVSN